MNKTDLKSFFRGSAVSMLGVGILGILNYFIRRTLSLNLSEIDYGFIYSAFALVMIIMVFLDLGLGQSLIILLAKNFAENNLHSARKVFTLTFMVKMLLALGVFMIMGALSPDLTRLYFKYPGSSVLLALIFLLIPVQTLESALLCVITARKAFFIQNLLMNMKMFIVLAGILSTVRVFGVKAWIIGTVAASAAVTGLAFRLAKSYGISLLPVRSIEFAGLKNIFLLSSWIAVSTAGISVMYYMDTVCLTCLSGLEAVALYNIALPIMQIAQSFFVFPAIFTPFVAEMWQKQDYAGIRHACIFASLAMLLTLPVFILVGNYFAPDIITFLFSEKYVAAAPAVTVLWAGMVFFAVAGFNINALNAGGRQKTAAVMVIICVLVNLILNVLLVPRFNYLGAALATAGSYVLMAVGSIIGLMFVLGRDMKRK
ncbi:MAG: polysaccharide biosynthesis C-terminal domain-containing protein [Victivallaceae bacterium]|nr:polysaccharide biosynthesis C-terminal domain-containing protein [Victivallaceae bacterium]